MILSQYPKTGIGKDRKEQIMKLVFEDQGILKIFAYED